MNFYIGCTHFFDDGILKVTERNFPDAKEMNDFILEKWNQKIRKTNTVYLLGDVGWVWMNKDREMMEQFVDYMGALNGRKILIVGNHDVYNLKMREFRHCFSDIYPCLEIRDHGTKLFLDHYPVEDWNGLHTGEIHLHAHTHGKGNIRNIPGRYDVSADCTGLVPVSLKEILYDSPEIEIEE